MTELVKSLPASKRPDISKPRWPQNTYEGRLRHYWATANPLNLFHTTAEIEAARRIVLDYRQDFDHHLFFRMPCNPGPSSLLFLETPLQPSFKLWNSCQMTRKLLHLGCCEWSLNVLQLAYSTSGDHESSIRKIHSSRQLSASCVERMAHNTSTCIRSSAVLCNRKQQNAYWPRTSEQQAFRARESMLGLSFFACWSVFKNFQRVLRKYAVVFPMNTMKDFHSSFCSLGYQQFFHFHLNFWEST